MDAEEALRRAAGQPPRKPRPWTLTDTWRAALGHRPPDAVDGRTLPAALRREDEPPADEQPGQAGIGTPDAAAGTGPTETPGPTADELLRRSI